MDRKGCIEAAARRLFSEKGFAAVSVKDIAEEAGVNPSLISYHFGGKEKLYALLFSRGEQKPAGKKDLIADTALRLFAERGYAQVSIRDISQAAGVNSASISYYFGGKKELYRFVLYRETEIVHTFASDTESGQRTPEDIFRLHSQLVCRFREEHPYGIRLLFWEMLCPTDVLGEFAASRIGQAAGILQNALRQGMKEGRFREDLSPLGTCFAWAGMVMFFFFGENVRKWVDPKGEVQMDEYMEQVYRLFLSGTERRPK